MEAALRASTCPDRQEGARTSVPSGTPRVPADLGRHRPTVLGFAL